MNPSSNLSIDYLDLLPDEVLLEILIKTDDLDTLSRWCQTSKRINNICQDKVLWKLKYQKDFDLSGDAILVEGETWQKLYKQMVLAKMNSPISIGTSGYGIIDQKGNLYMTGTKAILGIGPQPQIKRFSRKQHLVKFPSNDKNGSLSNLYNLSQKVVSISVSSLSVGAVTADGKVYVWGWNPFDIFNVGKEIDKINSPRELILPGKVIRIEVCPNGYIVLLEDFTVYFHIFNGIFHKVYFRHIIDLKVIDISIGANMYAIITKDYELYISPPNLSNKLISFKFPKPIKRALLGHKFIMILSITGEVYTQAYNDYTRKGPMFSKTKLKLIKLPEPIVQISLGDGTYAAISGSGKLYMWGSNYEDKISSNLTRYGSKLEKILEPVEISFGLPINFISVGTCATLAVSNDGSVNHWGDSWLSPE